MRVRMLLHGEGILVLGIAGLNGAGSQFLAVVLMAAVFRNLSRGAEIRSGMSDISMSNVKPKDEVRDEYRREELGHGVRGKYLAKTARGTKLVVLEGKVAAAFPDSDAVNEAQKGLHNLTDPTTKLTTGANGRAKSRR